MTPRTLFARARGLAVLLALAVTGHAAGDFYLKDGDRVVFYGDSITDQRLYTTFAETYVVTRFPALKIDFTHSGWGGDRVTGGGGGSIETRLQRDVFAYKPTVMTIMLGMNDGSYRAFDEGIFNTYKNGLTSIVNKVQSTLPGVRLTLIQPSPFDDVTREPKFAGGYNAVLVRYGEAVKELALANQQTVADLNTPVVAMLTKAREANADLSVKIIPDRVHPGPAGHLIMAEALLKSWNAPSLVSDVELDAKGGTLRTVRAAATQVTLSGGGALAWTQLDTALPMPVDLSNAETALAVASSDFEQALNRELLRVTHLTAPYYELNIDGQRVGSFSREEWAQGINLAMRATPMSAQAAAVHKLTLQRTGIHQARWRTVQVPFAEPRSEALKKEMPAMLAALDAEAAAIAAAQHEAARPVSHRYELAPQTELLVTSAKNGPVLPTGVGANLALNKPYVSSAENTYGWNDGLTDGSWAAARGTTYATNDAADFPKTATIDLQATAPVGFVVVGVPPFGSTKTVAVSVSADGKTFKEVGRNVFSLKTEEKRVFTFAPEQARYVRLTYVDQYDEKVQFPATFAFTTEVQVFGPVKK